MRRKELENRIKILEQQLFLITIHQEEFIEKEGKTGVQERINAILDEYLKRKTALQKLLLEDQSNAENHDNEKK
jgi:hypothetical protein